MSQKQNNNYGIIYMGTRPTYDQKQFIGKKVFITGGSSGIGFATAMTFARFGADVVIISRDSNASWFNGSGAVERIKADPVVKENNGKIRWYKADVSNKENMTALFKQFETEKWEMDLAVNNAGIVGAIGTLANTAKYFGGEHDPIRNNLQGTIICLDLEIAHFKKTKKDGAIVNLASVNGMRGAPGAPLYPTSKFGILGLTRSVGTEYARGTPTIRINAIAPGFTNTSLVWQQVKGLIGLQLWEGDYITPASKLWQDNKQRYLDRCPTGDMADPMDQANMIAFLLAEESSLITGSIFTVDGLISES